MTTEKMLPQSHRVREPDRQLGREPDHISAQLAGGLVQEAGTRGLGTVGAARFTADGSKVGMTDTADLDCPWGRTAIGDVARLAAQPLQKSYGAGGSYRSAAEAGAGDRAACDGAGSGGHEETGPKGPRLG